MEKVDKKNIPLYSEKYDEIVNAEKSEKRISILKVKKFINKFQTIIIISFYVILVGLIFWYWKS